MKPFAFVPAVLFLGLLVPGAAAQRALHASDDEGQSGLREHGHTLAAAGDLDGDGVGDYWVGAPAVTDGGLSGVVLVSGATGASLRSMASNDSWGGSHIERFGYALAGGRDLSGDGVPDVAVGAPRAGAKQRGALRVFSGADGNLLRELVGRAPGERFGEAVALLDDVDGDGLAELAVGAPGDDRGASDRGSVRIHSGASGALLVTLFGASAQEEFGALLANAGDIDEDGRDELFVGVPRGEVGVPDSGKALLLSGASGDVLRTLAGAATGDDFGRAVAGCADLDGDGVRDLLVGAPGARTVFAFSGASGAELWSATRTYPESSDFALIPDKARFGWAVCGLGDQNGDGRPDVAVGYPESSSVWTLSGADGSTLRIASSASLGASGASLFGYLGFALAPLGDLDGDGLEELGVGAPVFSFYQSFSVFPGRAFVLEGGMPRGLVHGGALETIGQTVSGAGDVNGDGADDVAFSRLVGGVPSVAVVSGRNGAVLRTFPGAPGSGFGRSLARAGDVDADGVEDLLVGAYTDPSAGPSAGSVRVYSGATGAVLYTRAGRQGDFLGLSVAGLGDVNGDGHADFAAGAPRRGHDFTGSSFSFCVWESEPPGYVRVYSGADGALLFQIDGQVHVPFSCYPYDFLSVHAGELFGYSLTGVGDWDQDGVPDLAVGAPGAGKFFSGAVRVFSGIDGFQLAEFLGSSPQNEFGISLAGGPGFDFDADGFVDLAVGEEEIYYAAAVSGAVHVFSSKSSTSIFAATVGATQIPYGGTIGPAYAIAVAGDFDRDGHSDLAVADPTAPSLLGPGAGRVRVISGATGATLRTATGSSSWDYLGYSLANAGDTDSDGRPDLVIGTPTAMDWRFSGSAFAPFARASVRLLAPQEKRKKAGAVGGATTLTDD
jgi:hypothetical protein